MQVFSRSNNDKTKKGKENLPAQLSTQARFYIQSVEQKNPIVFCEFSVMMIRTIVKRRGVEKEMKCSEKLAVPRTIKIKWPVENKMALLISSMIKIVYLYLTFVQLSSNSSNSKGELLSFEGV